MPPGPYRCHVLTHTNVYTIVPFTFIKPCLAPLSHFLDEGLLILSIMLCYVQSMDLHNPSIVLHKAMINTLQLHVQ